MRADEERFYESVKDLDRESLLSGYVDLHKKYEELLRFLKRKLGRKFVNNTFGIDENDSIVDIKR